VLEVAFSESVAGSLKYAAGRKRGQMVGQGAVSVICDDPAEKKRILAQMQKPKIWQGGELNCSAKDVVSLHLQLDWGGIAELGADLNARRSALEQLYGDFPGVADELIGAAKKALEQVFSAQEMRLWIGGQDACDIIAAFWICHLLRGKNVKMHAVYLPAMEQTGSEIICYGGAGDFEPERLSLEARNAHEITPEMQRYMANRFCELAEENAPLRAMVAGRVLSVPENIYDTALLSCVPEGECKLGLVIGKALGKLRAVGDDILRRRVRSLLSCGVLELVCPEQDENPYSAVVKRGPLWGNVMLK